MLRIKKHIGERGQIVIPKNIRDLLGLKTGTPILFEVKGKDIIIKPFIESEKFVEEFCNVPKKLKKEINIKKIIEEEIENVVY